MKDERIVAVDDLFARLLAAPFALSACAGKASHRLPLRARRVGMLEYAMERPEGLRRDRLYCYDLELPDAFVPHAADGEVESFELWPITRVVDTVRETDDFKFNVNLVLIDLFLREGVIGGEAATTLRAALEDGRV